MHCAKHKKSAKKILSLMLESGLIETSYMYVDMFYSFLKVFAQTRQYSALYVRFINTFFDPFLCRHATDSSPPSADMLPRIHLRLCSFRRSPFLRLNVLDVTRLNMIFFPHIFVTSSTKNLTLLLFCDPIFCTIKTCKLFFPLSFLSQLQK